MPSCLPGFFSGGQSLVSGNPFSGTMIPEGGVQLRISPAVSGALYVGVALGLKSGGITITSGGDLSSGGMADGVILVAGDSYFIPRLLCSGNLDKIKVAVPAAISGTMRVFWEAI